MRARNCARCTDAAHGVGSEARRMPSESSLSSAPDRARLAPSISLPREASRPERTSCQRAATRTPAEPFPHALVGGAAPRADWPGLVASRGLRRSGRPTPDLGCGPPAFAGMAAPVLGRCEIIGPASASTPGIFERGRGRVPARVSSPSRKRRMDRPGRATRLRARPPSTASRRGGRARARRRRQRSPSVKRASRSNSSGPDVPGARADRTRTNPPHRACRRAPREANRDPRRSRSEQQDRDVDASESTLDPELALTSPG